jgi:hypothetical protein
MVDQLGSKWFQLTAREILLAAKNEQTSAHNQKPIDQS